MIPPQCYIYGVYINLLSQSHGNVYSLMHAPPSFQRSWVHISIITTTRTAWVRRHVASAQNSLSLLTTCFTQFFFPVPLCFLQCFKRLLIHGWGNFVDYFAYIVTGSVTWHDIPTFPAQVRSTTLWEPINTTGEWHTRNCDSQPPDR